MSQMEPTNTTDHTSKWNAEEVIKQANNWSLAGDAMILKSIKAFASNVLSKTEKFSGDIDNLLNSLDEVGLTLSISQNEFQSLRNTQFIENRVYEDDETLDSNVEEKVVDKVSPEEKETSVTESIIMGMAILDKYYDAVEVSLSDSEDESEMSFVLRPKDVYSHRALPPVIGTDEWYGKWNSQDSSSGSESDRVSEIYSESDSEDNLPKDLLKGSETSSELDFSSQTSDTRPVANSTLNETTKKLDSPTESDDSERDNPLPVKSPLSNKTFAQQLAAKLDNVLSKEENQRVDKKQIDRDSLESKEEEINKQPIKPARNNKYGDIGGDLFFDEPPPLFDPPAVKTGLFSGGQGLFEENDEPLIWDDLTRAEPAKQPDRTENTKQAEKLDVPEKISFLPKSSQISKGLFDSEDSSDDDFFGLDKRKLGQTPFLRSNNPVVPLFDDEPPELQIKVEAGASSKKEDFDDSFKSGSSESFEGGLFQKEQQSDRLVKETVSPTVHKIETSKKKLVEKSNLFDDDEESHTAEKISNPSQDEMNKIQGTKTASDIEKKESARIPNVKKGVSLFDEFDDNMNAASAKPKISLFDDDDDLFKDDLFSEVTSKKYTSNLFDDIENTTISFISKGDNINTKHTLEENEKIKDINRNSLTMLDDGISGQNTFLSTDESSDNQKPSEEKQHDDNTGNYIDDNLGMMNDQKFEKSLNNNIDLKNESISPSSGIENEDLFENKRNVDITYPGETGNDPFPKSHPEEIVERECKGATSAPTIRLFDSTPPPDDDGDSDSKSDFSYTEDLTPYQVESHLESSSIFDNEPPSLDANESSGIVRDQNNTRVDTDDSSFNPHASSSRRLSSDIFTGQQLQDSFFLTKSRIDSATPSNLGMIPENSDQSTNSDSRNFTENSNAAEDTLGRNNLFGNSLSSALFDDVFSNDEIPNVSLGTSREQNLNVKKTLIPDKTEVDGEVHINKKISGIDDVMKSQAIVTEKAMGSPGKLKHNLNINVDALLPGYAPPRTRVVTKSSSLEESPVEMEEEDIFTSNNNFLSPASVEDSTNGNVNKPIITFGNTETIEVLSSITRDRAKIPIKRKPSTRRGRQEAIRKSAIENVPDEGNDLENFEENKPAKETISCTASSTEDDNMNVGEEMKKNMNPFEIPPASAAKSIDTTKKLFGSESESDDDLFASRKAESNRKDSISVKKSLFDDSSSDDDLFKVVSRRNDTGKNDPPVEKKIKKAIPRKFDQSSGDPLSDLLK